MEVASVSAARTPPTSDGWLHAWRRRSSMCNRLTASSCWKPPRGGKLLHLPPVLRLQARVRLLLRGQEHAARVHDGAGRQTHDGLAVDARLLPEVRRSMTARRIACRAESRRRVDSNRLLDERAERRRVAVRLVPQEPEIRKQVVHVVLQRRAGQAPAALRRHRAHRRGDLRTRVFHRLRFVQNHAEPLDAADGAARRPPHQRAPRVRPRARPLSGRSARPRAPSAAMPPPGRPPRTSSARRYARCELGGELRASDAVVHEHAACSRTCSPCSPARAATA